MRLAIFTDIHGNIQALNSILKDIKKRDVDLIISLGDVIGLGPSSNECMDKINSLDNIIKIAGNHELYYTKGVDKGHVINDNILEYNKWVHKHIKCDVDDSRLDYLIEHNNKKLYFTHYFLRDSEYPFESSKIFETDEYKKIFDKYNYDYVFYGHRHKERIDEYNNNLYYGLDSSGCTKDDNTFYLLIDLDKDITIEKINIKYDRKTFEKVINNIEFPDQEHICDYFFGIKKSANN